MRKNLLVFIGILFFCINYTYAQKYNISEGSLKDTTRNVSLTYRAYFPLEFIFTPSTFPVKDQLEAILYEDFRILKNCSVLVTDIMLSFSETYRVIFASAYEGYNMIVIHQMNYLTGASEVIYRSDMSYQRNYNSYYQEYKDLCNKYILQF